MCVKSEISSGSVIFEYSITSSDAVKMGEVKGEIIVPFAIECELSGVEGALKDGFLGLLTGLFNLSSSGLSFAVFSAFIFALIFKPRG